MFSRHVVRLCLGRLGAVSLALAGLVLLPSAGSGRESVVDAAAKYVADYERELTSIVADEVYTQEIRRQVPAMPGAPPRRRAKSEIFFMFMPMERTWMAIRDVLEIDGLSVDDGPRVREALRTLHPLEVGASMRRANASLNIGRIVRNFNEPTLALLALDPAHRERFRFDTGKPRRVGGSTRILVEFEERERPTLIRNMKGEPVFLEGEVDVEPVTGRIWNSVVRASVGPVRLELSTEYARDDRLELILPRSFHERYEEGNPSARPDANARSATGGYELILCEARYSNYRRFETSVRVK
jgi:hypothetical protein